MFKSRMFVAFLFIAVTLLAGCGLTEGTITLTGSGDVVTQKEDITGFDRVDISHAFQVDIRRGEAFRVVVRVDDNLLEHLRVDREGDTLRIGFKPGQSYNIREATLQAEVTMPELTGLNLSGASHATITGFASTELFDADLSGASVLQGDIQAGDVRFGASGASRVILSGSAGDVTINASGASVLDLADLPAADADVEASGASVVTVDPSGRLDARASGASQIYYLGSPVLGRQDTSGSSFIRGK